MTPPTGWSYRERATGQWFFHTTRNELIQKVREHREYKGLPLDTIVADIEDQICLRLDERWCRACDGETYTPIKDRTTGLTTEMANAANRAIISFIKGAVVSFLKGESPFVAPEVAKARAATCFGCPFNKPLNGCSCQEAYKVIEALIPAKRHQPGSHICAACGCSLQAKINMPDDVIRASITPQMTFPPWCWQRPLQGNQK